jgi:hypothetical protein
MERKNLSGKAQQTESRRSDRINGLSTHKALYSELGDSVPKSTHIGLETVEVEIPANTLLGDYATAFVQEAELRHPDRADRVGLKQDELLEYCKFLISKRVATVHRTVTDAGKLRDLYIPDFIQLCLETIGEVVYDEMSVVLIPVYKAKVMSLDEAYNVSRKLAQFKDLLRMNRNAMPRGTEGDVEVMSSILSEQHVRCMREIHPVSAIVTSFLGLTIQKEIILSSLYRVEYRNASAIRRAVLQREEMF